MTEEITSKLSCITSPGNLVKRTLYFLVKKNSQQIITDGEMKKYQQMEGVLMHAKEVSTDVVEVRALETEAQGARTVQLKKTKPEAIFPERHGSRTDG